MTDKELRRLRRDDLLQILIDQQRQIDEMTAALERSEKALADRNIAIEEAGNLAEASMKLNGVFEAAQSAADEYLRQMRERADEVAANAEKQAEESKRLADSVVAGARSEADRILRQARIEAEAMVKQAIDSVQPPKAEEAPSGNEDGGKRRRGLLRRNR